MQRHPRLWRVAIGALGASDVVLAVGVAVLAAALSTAAVSAVALGAALAFSIGTALAVFTTTFEIAATYPPPETSDRDAWRDRLEPLNWWGYINEVAYLAIAFASMGALGWAMLASAILPTWLGWFLIVVGSFFSVNVITGVPRVGGAAPALVPYWVHVIALLIGIVALTAA